MLSERRVVSKKVIDQWGGLEQTIYQLGEIAEQNAIEFEMKTVVKIQHPMVYLEPHIELIPLRFKWWQKILKRLHFKYYLRITIGLEPIDKYEEKIKTQEFEFPEDLITSIFLQRRYWEKQNLEPTKLLVSRDVYSEIRADVQKYTNLIPSNFSGMEIFGLKMMVSPFFTGKIALVC